MTDEERTALEHLETYFVTAGKKAATIDRAADHLETAGAELLEAAEAFADEDLVQTAQVALAALQTAREYYRLYRTKAERERDKAREELRAERRH